MGACVLEGILYADVDVCPDTKRRYDRVTSVTVAMSGWSHDDDDTIAPLRFCCLCGLLTLYCRWLGDTQYSPSICVARLSFTADANWCGCSDWTRASFISATDPSGTTHADKKFVGCRCRLPLPVFDRAEANRKFSSASEATEHQSRSRYSPP